MQRLIAWIEQVYKDNGVWPALIVGIVIVILIVAGTYLDAHWETWLP